MTKDNGGPAFPTTAGQVVYSHGMSLRDWFAGQALAGIGTWMPLSGNGNLATQTAMNARSIWAYEQADAMLAARKDTPDEH